MSIVPKGLKMQGLLKPYLFWNIQSFGSLGYKVITALKEAKGIEDISKNDSFTSGSRHSAVLQNQTAVNKVKTSTTPKREVQNDRYYVAQVTADKLNLRTGPGAFYQANGYLKKGDEVVISGEDLNKEFGVAISVDGDKYGYVSTQYLRIANELKGEYGNVLQEAQQLISTRNESVIKIKSKVDRAITVQINKKPYTIPAGQTITIEGVCPGKVVLLATAKGLRPYYGIDELRGGYVYDWVFYITNN